MSTAPAPPASLWERISTWSSENKAVVYTVAGVLVVSLAGGSVYYYNRRSKHQKDDEEATTPEESTEPTKDAATKKKSKKRSKKVSPAQPEQSSATTKVEDAEPTVDVSRLSTDEKRTHANVLKKSGNEAYAKKDHTAAIDFYTKAIDVYASDPVFYSNRAACHAAQGNQEAVIRDTSKALELDPSYVKALNRRAAAYEQSGKLQEALLDLTASSILDNFENQNATTGIERLLKKVAEQKAREMLQDRSARMPASSFISAYLDAFRQKPAPEITSEDESQGDVHLKRALDSIAARQYKTAISHLQDAEGKPFGSADLEALALNTAATFKFVRADVEGAMADINRSIELRPKANSYVKRASMYMELGDRTATLEDFQKAIEIDAEDPDIYYHRGQCNFIVQDFGVAAKDYQKSIDLDPDFVFSHVQLGVAQYKLNSIATSMATFRRCVARFADSPEVFNYYGELLLDQGKFEEAVDKFDGAIKLERASKKGGHQNVMPLINKALAVFQWKKDISQAEDLCKQALELDPESDVALATLSQFLLTQGKAKDALQYFERSAEVARTESEIVNALSYAEATRTQLELERKYPDLAQRMASIASAARAQQGM